MQDDVEFELIFYYLHEALSLMISTHFIQKINSNIK